MHDEFMKPTLLAGLFAPPEELSAGATMGVLYFYGMFQMKTIASVSFLGLYNTPPCVQITFVLSTCRRYWMPSACGWAGNCWVFAAVDSRLCLLTTLNHH
jgi:hypothetical protein